MMSINGEFQLLQLSSNRYWPLGQLSSQPFTVSLSVSLNTYFCITATYVQLTCNYNGSIQ